MHAIELIIMVTFQFGRRYGYKVSVFSLQYSGSTEKVSLSANTIIADLILRGINI